MLNSSEETEKLVVKQENPLPTISDHRRNNNSYFLSLLLQPLQWLQMLSSKLNPTFVLGVILVYGLSQGLSGSFFKVVTDYYWKDVQRVEPSTVQLYMGFYYIPWVMKPVWGILTDVFPIKGYNRRPYFVIAGVIGCFSSLMVALMGELPVGLALFYLIGVAAGMAIADVTIDACIARNSIEMKSLTSDMQSLCGFCSSAGALIGYSSSGFFVHHLGPQAMENLGVAIKGMYKTIKYPQVWKPSLYMFLSLASSFSTHEGQFYWYTDPKAGPAFSREFVGIIHAFGALASIGGVLIYHKTLKDYPFRNIIFFAQLIYGISGMLDLVFILRWNLSIGIPDYFFVIMEECISRIVSKVRWMPMIVLTTRLCPLGIEGTFFALLTCIDSMGSLSSKWGGGLVLHWLHVTRNDFENLWVVVLIRNCLRLGMLSLVFLIPNADQSDDIIPSDFLERNSRQSSNDEGLQLVHTNSKDQDYL